MLLLLTLTAVTALKGYAQTEGENAEIEYTNDGKGWVFGLNMGVYYPSKYTAAYYNGAATNENNVKFILSNTYRYDELFLALDAHDSIMVSGLPQNMHYKLAMQPGIYAQYCFSPKIALVIQFNYLRLKANDVIIFDVDPPQDYLGNHDLRLFPMRGVEERIYADIGIKQSFPKSEKLSFFAMGGLNVNSTQVKKSAFYVEEKEYSMINNYIGSYVPGGNSQTVNIYQGGVGIGIFASGGVSLTFNNGIVLEPGFTAHFLKVKLNGYKNMSPGFGTSIRFLF